VDWQNLNQQFTSNEAKPVLNSMQPLKAPGLDGFHAMFFQRNWVHVAPNFTEAILNVLDGKDMPVGMNKTHIVLILKIDHPHMQRLKPLQPKLISPTQGAFVAK